MRNYDAHLSLIHLKAWSALEFFPAHPHPALGSSNPKHREYLWLLNAWGRCYVRKPTLSLFSLKGENKEQDKRLGISEEHSPLTPRTGSPNLLLRRHSGIISSGHNLILSRMIWKKKVWSLPLKELIQGRKMSPKVRGSFLQVILKDISPNHQSVAKNWNVWSLLENFHQVKALKDKGEMKSRGCRLWVLRIKGEKWQEELQMVLWAIGKWTKIVEK